MPLEEDIKIVAAPDELPDLAIQNVPSFVNPRVAQMDQYFLDGVMPMQAGLDIMQEIASSRALPPGFIYLGSGAERFVQRTHEEDYRREVYDPVKEMLRVDMPEVVDIIRSDSEVADLANIGLEWIVVGPGEGKDLRFITEADLRAGKTGGVIVLSDVNSSFLSKSSAAVASSSSGFQVARLHDDCFEVDSKKLDELTRDLNDRTQTRQRVIYETGLLASNSSFDSFIEMCDSMLGEKGGHVLIDLPTFDGTAEDLSQKAAIYKHPTNLKLFSDNFKRLFYAIGVPQQYMQYFDDWIRVRELEYIHSYGRKDHSIAYIQSYCRLVPSVLDYLRGLGFFSGISAEEIDITLGKRLRFQRDSLEEIFAEKGYSIEFQRIEERTGVAMLLLKKIGRQD